MGSEVMEKYFLENCQCAGLRSTNSFKNAERRIHIHYGQLTKTTLYGGVTSALKTRIEEHKSGFNSGSFTARYKLHYLVYYESFLMIGEAIAREKQIKAGSRKKKEELIDKLNPGWRDLQSDILTWA